MNPFGYAKATIALFSQRFGAHNVLRGNRASNRRFLADACRAA